MNNCVVCGCDLTTYPLQKITQHVNECLDQLTAGATTTTIRPKSIPISQEKNDVTDFAIANTATKSTATANVNINIPSNSSSMPLKDPPTARSTGNFASGSATTNWSVMKSSFLSADQAAVPIPPTNHSKHQSKLPADPSNSISNRLRKLRRQLHSIDSDLNSLHLKRQRLYAEYVGLCNDNQGIVKALNLEDIQPTIDFPSSASLPADHPPASSPHSNRPIPSYYTSPSISITRRCGCSCTCSLFAQQESSARLATRKRSGLLDRYSRSPQTSIDTSTLSEPNTSSTLSLWAKAAEGFQPHDIAQLQQPQQQPSPLSSTTIGSIISHFDSKESCDILTTEMPIIRTTAEGLRHNYLEPKEESDQDDIEILACALLSQQHVLIIDDAIHGPKSDPPVPTSRSSSAHSDIKQLSQPPTILPRASTAQVAIPQLVSSPLTSLSAPLGDDWDMEDDDLIDLCATSPYRPKKKAVEPEINIVPPVLLFTTNNKSANTPTRSASLPISLTSSVSINTHNPTQPTPISTSTVRTTSGAIVSVTSTLSTNANPTGEIAKLTSLTDIELQNMMKSYGLKLKSRRAMITKLTEILNVSNAPSIPSSGLPPRPHKKRNAKAISQDKENFPTLSDNNPKNVGNSSHARSSGLTKPVTKNDHDDPSALALVYSLRDFIRSEEELYLQVLLLQPIDARQLHTLVNASGIKCSFDKLVAFMIDEGIQISQTTGFGRTKRNGRATTSSSRVEVDVL